MNQGVAGIIATILVWGGFAIGFVMGAELAKGKYRDEAFHRGYMVECLGKAGYYWECEE